jgi:hypothetical protein
MNIDKELFQQAKQRADEDPNFKDNTDPTNCHVIIRDAIALTMREPIETIQDVISTVGAALEYGFYIGLKYTELQNQKSVVT